MMYTLTILEEQYDRLVGGLFSLRGHEGAAYLLCGRSSTEGETRFLVREVIPVEDKHYLIRERDRLSIASESYVAVAKKAFSLATPSCLSIPIRCSPPSRLKMIEKTDDSRCFSIAGCRAHCTVRSS